MDKITKKNLIITVVITAVLLIGIMVSAYAWYMDYRLKVDDTAVIAQTDDVVLTEKENVKGAGGFGTITYIATNRRDLPKTYIIYANVYKVTESGVGGGAVNGKPTLADHVMITVVNGLDQVGHSVVVKKERVQVGKITLSAFEEKEFKLTYSLVFEPEQIYLQGDRVIIDLHVE
jgi:hypothetical protein